LPQSLLATRCKCKKFVKPLVSHCKRAETL
jgi:hypothetical protein